jgi:hypothetical protein
MSWTLDLGAKSDPATALGKARGESICISAVAAAAAAPSGTFALLNGSIVEAGYKIQLQNFPLGIGATPTAIPMSFVFTVSLTCRLPLLGD